MLGVRFVHISFFFNNFLVGFPSLFAFVLHSIHGLNLDDLSNIRSIVFS